MAQPRRRHESSEQACLECQRRKTRCTFRKGENVCTYCNRSGKTCRVSERSEKTALTRKNLDAAERRCRELEEELTSLQAQRGSSSEARNPQFVSHDWAQNVTTAQDATVHAQLHNPRATEEHYDWEEEAQLDDGRHDRASPDGMVSSQRPTGYYGASSASNMLESLSSILSPVSTQSPAVRPDTGNTPVGLPRSTLVRPGLVYSCGITISFVHEHLINTYFQAYNSSYPILHEQMFRQQLSKSLNRPKRTIFHIIHYMVLAIGEWISGDAAEDLSVYYEAARSRLKFEILETGNIAVVQAFLLLGNYLQKRDRPNTAYNFIGIAYRVALGLGLHCEPRSTNAFKPFIMQQRRQIFWILYCFDSGFSLTTGRPTLISDTFIDAKKPKNVNDTLYDVNSTEIQEVNYPTTCSAIIAQTRLAVIANKIYSNLLSLRSAHEVDTFTSTMEHAIDNWRQALPVYFFQDKVPQWFRASRQIVLWKEANIRIILLLASQRHASEEEDKVVLGAKCSSVAKNTIFDIAKFCNQHLDLVHTGVNWYAVYFTLHAILALAFQVSLDAKRIGSRVMIQEKESSHTVWDLTRSQARSCLEKLQNGNRAAIRTLQILDRLQDSFAASTPATALPNTTPAGNSVNGSEPNSALVSTNAGFTNGDTVGQSHGATASHMFPPSMPSGFSPDMLMTDLQTDDWFGSADPSLHMYFGDETAGLDEIFRDFQGFPCTTESQGFAYTTNGLNMTNTGAHGPR